MYIDKLINKISGLEKKKDISAALTDVVLEVLGSNNNQANGAEKIVGQQEASAPEEPAVSADPIKIDPKQIAAEVSEPSATVVINTPPKEDKPKDSDKKPVKGKGGGNSEEPPGGELAAKMAGIEKKMADAYRNFFSKKITKEQRTEIIDKEEEALFHIYKKENSALPRESGKKARDFRESVYSRVNQERIDAKAKREQEVAERKKKTEGQKT